MSSKTLNLYFESQT